MCFVLYNIRYATGRKALHRQLNSLYRLVRRTERPCLVAGDFNMLWGEREIEQFLAATGLRNANRRRLPTFPSTNPTRHLDFVLHSKEITVRRCEVPRVPFSDHLPLVVDFDVGGEQDLRREPRQSSCRCPSCEVTAAAS